MIKEQIPDCLTCGDKKVGYPHWFVNPTQFIVPCEYYLCEKHKDDKYDFDDIYHRDGTRKALRKL